MEAFVESNRLKGKKQRLKKPIGSANATEWQVSLLTSSA